LKNESSIVYLILFVLATLNTSVSCHSSGNGNSQELDIDWQPCDLFTGEQPDPLPEDIPETECAEIEVPVFWNNPDGNKITLFLKRAKAREARRGSIWILTGGPGQSGIPAEWSAFNTSLKLPSYDIYLPDHRGTGRSALLECPDQTGADDDEDSESAPLEVTAVLNGEIDQSYYDCADHLIDEWGDDLPGFNTTEAARDIGNLITATRRDEDEIFLLGVSYGTYWLHRYLQLFPDQADGVVLDSLLPIGLLDVNAQNVSYNAVGEDLMQYCAEDPYCSGKLRDNPLGRISQVIDKLENGHCAELFGAEFAGQAQTLFPLLLGLMLDSFWNREHIPAFIYRVDRCDDGDIEAINNMIEQTISAEPESEDGDLSMSEALNIHITLSEIIAPLLTHEQNLDFASNANFLISPPYDYGPLYDYWPRYPVDEYSNVWATTDVPMLMMNGDLDPKTPIEESKIFIEHFNGPYQYFEEIPLAGHNAMFQSPTSETVRYCGFEMVLSFITNPTGYDREPCLDYIASLDFLGEPEPNFEIWGKYDRWENGDDWSPSSKHSNVFDKIIRTLRKRHLP
jgi:pimeloyl-ACP methyl ester carboxylesterase